MASSRRFALVFALFDVFARAQRGFQDFEDGDASLAAGLGKQALRDDEAESLGEAIANGVLLGHGKRPDDALDGLGGVNGVQRGHDQVAGLGGFQRDLDGFAVAHLADQDDLGRLAQRGAQRQREGRRVAVQLALVDRGFLVVVQEFDGVLDGEDVHGAFFVHPIDDRRQRRGLCPSRWGR